MKSLLGFILIFSLFGCHTINLEELKERDRRSRQFDDIRQQRALGLEEKYFNMEQAYVWSYMGKPRYQERGPFSYRLDRNCHGSNCETSAADEMWVYEFYDEYQGERIFYTHNIYFFAGKVVAVY